MYGARLIVGMLTNYFTCIALKIVVYEMIALIKNEQLKVYEYEILLEFSVFKSEFNNWQILLLAHCSTEAEN